MANVTSNIEYEAKADLADVEKILRLAEELQTKVETAGPRVLVARFAFGLAIAILAFAPTPMVGGILYRSTGMVFPASTIATGALILVALPLWYFGEHLFIARVHRQVRRDQRALSQAVTLLQELQSTLAHEHRWSTLDQALFKIRMARFDVEVAKTDVRAPQVTPLDDPEQRFSLIDSLVDDSSNQWVIFMHEHTKDVPRYLPYVYQHGDGGAGSGLYEMSVNGKLERVGLARTVGSGRYVSLTPEGHKYAEWLLIKGRKSDFFWTPVGGWGEVSSDSMAGQWRTQAVEQMKQRYNPTYPGVPVPPAVSSTRQQEATHPSESDVAGV